VSATEMTTASSLRSAGSLLGDPPGALCLSMLLIRLSSVGSRKDYRTQANALHLKHPSHSGFDVVPADIATASTDLSRLTAVSGPRPLEQALAVLAGGLAVYTGYVADAESEYSLGYPLSRRAAPA